MRTPLLQVNDLTIRSVAQRKRLVADVSFTVSRGEAFTLIGETGSGKTLVAQAVCSCLPEELVAGGAVDFKGVNLARLPAKEKRRIYGKELFLLPQEPNSALDPVMLVAGQVSEIFRYVRRYDPQELRHTLAALFSDLGLSLSGNGRLYPCQLSGGMQQRILLAIGLAVPAEFIVVDEPTKGLDAISRASAVKKLKNLLSKGKTLLCITHDLSVARALGGRMAVMYGGYIVESGDVWQLLDAPKHPYTRGLVNAAPENGLIPIAEEVLAAMKTAWQNG